MRGDALPPLFAIASSPPGGEREMIRPGMSLLRGFAPEAEIFACIAAIAAVAPFRNMTIPSGAAMSVAMTNCGPLGWVADRRGYRYEPDDPLTGKPWPAMPGLFRALARDAAEAAGFSEFVPDACLVNRYAVGARMSAHQDRDEKRLGEPIVSVSIGLPATFFVHEGEARKGRTTPVRLESGDVVVFGGEARLAFHGVRDLKPGRHAVTGEYRYNLTMRAAL